MSVRSELKDQPSGAFHMHNTSNQKFRITVPITGYTLWKNAERFEWYVITGMASNSELDLTGEQMAETGTKSTAKHVAPINASVAHAKIAPGSNHDGDIEVKRTDTGVPSAESKKKQDCHTAGYPTLYRSRSPLFAGRARLLSAAIRPSLAYGESPKVGPTET